jgi:CDGSH-type Zn-finger protein
MRFDEVPDLPLRETKGAFKQLFIGLVDELNHLYTRDDNYREACPSLCYHRKNMPATVTIFNNGPIRLEGEFVIQDAEGNPYGLAGRTVISLCRCGMAENKPFCDGSHGRNGFSSLCKARNLDPPKPKV